MIKLAAFDMDGTLLDNNHKISAKNKQALQMLLDQNIKVVIATGRPNDLIKEYIQDLNINEYVITCNGSVIYNHFTEEFLYYDKIDQETIKRVVNYLRTNDIDFLVYEKNFIASYNDNERYLFFTESNKRLPQNVQAKFIHFDSLNKAPDELDINKILIIENDQKKYLDALHYLQAFNGISVTQSRNTFIDIGPECNSKGNALKILTDVYNIKASEIIAFGDQLNDISMLKYAGIGVAMGNAKDEVKKHSDQITLSNDEDGVFHKINELLNSNK